MIEIKNIDILKNHTDLPETLLLRNNNEILMSAGRDGKVNLWNTESQEVFFSWLPYNGIELHHADFSIDMRFLLVHFGMYNEARVIEMESRRVFDVPLLTDYCCSPCFAPNNSIVSYIHNFVYHIDICNHQGIKVLFKADSRILSLTWFYSRKYFVLLTRKGVVSVVDASSGHPVVVIPQKYLNPDFIYISQDDLLVIIGYKKSNCIDIWRVDFNESCVKTELINSFTEMKSLFRDKYGDCRYGYINFMSSDTTFVCGVITPLTYVDCSTHEAQEIQVHDKKVGYIECIAIDVSKKKIIIPLGGDNMPGTIGVITYEQLR